MYGGASEGRLSRFGGESRIYGKRNGGERGAFPLECEELSSCRHDKHSLLIHHRSYVQRPHLRLLISNLLAELSARKSQGQQRLEEMEEGKRRTARACCRRDTTREEGEGGLRRGSRGIGPDGREVGSVQRRASGDIDKRREGKVDARHRIMDTLFPFPFVSPLHPFKLMCLRISSILLSFQSRIGLPIVRKTQCFAVASSIVSVPAARAASARAWSSTDWRRRPQKPADGKEGLNERRN